MPIGDAIWARNSKNCKSHRWVLPSNYMLTLPISTQHMWWWSQPSLELCRVPKMILQISVIVQARGLLRHWICVNYTVSCIRDGAEVCSPRRSCLWKALCPRQAQGGPCNTQPWVLYIQSLSSHFLTRWFHSQRSRTTLPSKGIDFFPSQLIFSLLIEHKVIQWITSTC